MHKQEDKYTEACLFFTVNSLARSINEMTERAFEELGISASYGHLMLLIIDEPNLNLSELSKRMNVKSSTMTRFIDKLQQKKYVERNSSGRVVSITPTELGCGVRPKIMEALKKLYIEYCDVLGEDFAKQLTTDINLANLKLYK